jgi:hypothetical protein
MFTQGSGKHRFISTELKRGEFLPTHHGRYTILRFLTLGLVRRGVMRFYMELHYKRMLLAACPLILFYLLLVCFSIEDVKKTYTACFYRDEILSKKFDDGFRDFSYTADRRTTADTIFPRKMNVSFTVDCTTLDVNRTLLSENIQRQCDLSDCRIFSPCRKCLRRVSNHCCVRDTCRACKCE